MKKIMVSMFALAWFGIPAQAQSSRNAKMNCPATTCTDHSYDQAFSARWQEPATDNSRQPVWFRSVPNNRSWSGMKDRVYTLKDFILLRPYHVRMAAPYHGQDAPSYDGAAKNAYRNMRANNTSMRLPSNNGK